MFPKIRIGSRASRLAIIQVKEILSQISPLPCSHEHLTFSSSGDLDKTTSLTSNPADDFFTDTLDKALLSHEIDIAIHSAKDLPQNIPDGLKIFALTKALDETDSWVSNYSLDDLPAGAKVGSSSALRTAQLKSIRPDINFVDIRGTIQDRLEQLDQKKIDGLVIATCALKRLGLESRIQSVLPWQAMALQGQLAVVGRESDGELEKLFSEIDVRKGFGDVFLVGAGPGDPKLITVKAIEVLQGADCVFYDYLVDHSLLKYAQKAEHIYVGKRKGKHSLSQEKLCAQLKEKAEQGKIVVRLKGGDPFIFGRGSDELAYLRSYHINVHVIPGVSSATGIPSSLGIPLTARGISSSVAFVSGHGESQGDPNDICIPQADTLIFLMGLTKLKTIVENLLKAGWSKSRPIMVVSQGTKANQKIILGNLENIEKKVYAQSIEAPALIMAGDTLSFYKKEMPKVYLHCGTHPERYQQYGQIIAWPMIGIEHISLTAVQKQEFIKDFEACDFIILTSPAAVEHFMKTALSLKSTQELVKKDFIVIGRATCEILEDFGIEARIVSKEETAEDLYASIVRSINLTGVKILFPRSSLPNPFLKDALHKKGAIVMEWAIYKNVKPLKRPLPEILIDGVIFTSPSTFHNFIEDYGTIPSRWKILAKGPVTSQALLDAGYKPHLVGL